MQPRLGSQHRRPQVDHPEGTSTSHRMPLPSQEQRDEKKQVEAGVAALERARRADRASREPTCEVVQGYICALEVLARHARRDPALRKRIEPATCRLEELVHQMERRGVDLAALHQRRPRSPGEPTRRPAPNGSIAGASVMPA